MSKQTPRKSIIGAFDALSLNSSTAVQVAEDGFSSGTLTHRPVARVAAGVIGATQRSLTDIREERDRLQALVAAGGGVELDATMIDPSPYPDRLPDDSSADFEKFKNLIADEGQKVPIQVRVHSSLPDRYQVVYGHRRWRAALALGRPVKAIIVDLSDSELVVAQGLENAARQDLTWIERALFAARMNTAGIKARDIRAALAVDDPELARFRAVCRAVPVELIEMIGRSPKIGRPRWAELGTILSRDSGALERIRKILAADKVRTLPSDERFHHAFSAVKTTTHAETADVDITVPGGISIGKAVFAKSAVKLTLEKSHALAFAAFLRGELPTLAQKFLAQQSGG